MPQCAENNETKRKILVDKMKNRDIEYLHFVKVVYSLCENGVFAFDG